MYLADSKKERKEGKELEKDVKTEIRIVVHLRVGTLLCVSEGRAERIARTENGKAVRFDGILTMREKREEKTAYMR